MPSHWGLSEMRTADAKRRGVCGPLSACGEERRFSEMNSKKSTWMYHFPRKSDYTAPSHFGLCRPIGSSYVNLTTDP